MAAQKSHVLSAIQMHYPDYHPLVAIAHLAHSNDADVDARLKFDCHRTIAKYVEPELKSLEVKGTIGEHRRVTVSLFDENAEVADAEIVQPKQLEVVHEMSRPSISGVDIDSVVDVY